MDDLLLLEQSVQTFIVLKDNLSSNEKAKRIQKVLGFMNRIYNKYNEQISIDEAWEILYGDE